MKHIQRDGRPAQGPHAVQHAPGNAPDIARPELPGDAANREIEPALKQHAHLLVRMRVLEDDGLGLQVHDREHHVFARDRLDLHAWKVHVPGTGPGRQEIRVRRIWRWFSRDRLTSGHWSCP